MKKLILTLAVVASSLGSVAEARTSYSYIFNTVLRQCLRVNPGAFAECREYAHIVASETLGLPVR